MKEICDFCEPDGRVERDTSEGVRMTTCPYCDGTKLLEYEDSVEVELCSYRLVNVDLRDNLEGECWLVVNDEPVAFFDRRAEHLQPSALDRFIQEELHG